MKRSASFVRGARYASFTSGYITRSLSTHSAAAQAAISPPINPLFHSPTAKLHGLTQAKIDEFDAASKGLKLPERISSPRKQANNLSPRRKKAKQ